MTRSRCDVCGRPPSWWVALWLGPVPVAPDGSVGLCGFALCDDCAIDGVPAGWQVAPYTPAEAS